MNSPTRRPGFPARLPGVGEVARATASGRPSGVAAGVQMPAVAPTKSGFAPAVSDRVWGMDSAAVRERMVQRLAMGGINHPAVLQAMVKVERHQFVDSGLVNKAYEDTSLPIGLGQTISKPSIVARMIQLLLESPLGLQGGISRVLEIGTGCGYQVAVLAEVVREVYSIERLRGLHERARVNLRPLRLANVHLLLGDGMQGYAKGGPYGGIIAAACGAEVPMAWCDQLAVGGRLVTPVVGPDGKQVLLVVDKTMQGLQQAVLEAVHFVPLKSGIA